MHQPFSLRPACLSQAGPTRIGFVDTSVLLQARKQAPCVTRGKLAHHRALRPAPPTTLDAISPLFLFESYICSDPDNHYPESPCHPSPYRIKLDVHSETCENTMTPDVGICYRWREPKAQQAGLGDSFLGGLAYCPHFSSWRTNTLTH